MKTLKIYLSILALGLVMIAACNKTETDTKTITISKSVTDGQAVVSGMVTYVNAIAGTNDPAPGAIIKIATDTNTKTFVQFWATDATGNFRVKGLGVGSYFIAAEYRDKNNYLYTTTGYTVTINNSVDSVSLNFLCK
jgi:Prealbumin-like fold domain